MLIVLSQILFILLSTLMSVVLLCANLECPQKSFLPIRLPQAINSLFSCAAVAGLVSELFHAFFVLRVGASYGPIATSASLAAISPNSSTFFCYVHNWCFFLQTSPFLNASLSACFLIASAASITLCAVLVCRFLHNL